MAELGSWMILIGIYILYFALPVFTIAYKSEEPNSWMAFVPVLNMWLLCEMADKPIWWIIMLLIPYVGIVFYAMIWMAISENTNKSPWLGLLMIIPLVNVITAYYMAFYEPDKISY